MSRNLMLHDLPETKPVIVHPGFKPVCLEKGNLRMAAYNFQTKMEAKISTNRIRRKVRQGTYYMAAVSNRHGSSCPHELSW